jgi:hypothetical protein
VQTRVSVSSEDNGKSIRLGVGDVLEVSLPETNAGAAWRVEVNTDVLAPVSSPTNTQAVWVLDEAEPMHLRIFRAVRVGYALLKMSYDAVADGTPRGSFALEVSVGDALKPRRLREAMPTPQLVILLFEFFLVTLAGALLSLRMALVVAARASSATADLLVALLGTVAMGTIAVFLLLRIASFFVGRAR